jgi:MATE family multidrug resistance protein
MIAKMGVISMAASQVALQIVQFAINPIVSVSQATAVLVSQAIGADRDELVPAMFRIALKIVGIFTLFCSLVLLLGAPLIARGATTDSQVVPVTVRLLHAAVITIFIDAANIIGRSTLLATGDVQTPMRVGVFTSWVVMPSLVWLLGFRLGFGVLGAWFGLASSLAVGLVILWYLAANGNWRQAAQRVRERLNVPRARARG